MMEQTPRRSTLKIKAMTDSGPKIMLITTRMVQLLVSVQLDRAPLKLPVANKEDFKHRGSVFLRTSRKASDMGNTMTLVSIQIVYVSVEIDGLIFSRRAMKDLRPWISQHGVLGQQ